MLSRRAFLGGSLASLAACRAPAIRSSRPAITHGVQAGDPSGGRAVIWARASEPARMVVEWDTSEGFGRARRVAGPVVTPEGGLAGAVDLEGLPAGQTISYRVRFEREAARGASDWAPGRLRTPRADRVRVAWTGDTCGQGFGRSPEWGGLRGYAAVRAAEPDVFVNSGDLIYADNEILAEKRLADGRVWRNVTNERVARVAQELDDFRARFAYNFEDEHVRALAAEVATIAQWDDHETRNNWWPGQRLDDPRYTRERDASTLAAMALRATREWTAIRGPTVHRTIHYGPLLDVFVLDCRSFRSPNTANLGDDTMLGAPQLDWLLGELARSTARWKLVACDQPIALVIPDDDRQEGFANGAPGEPQGRERELASLLRRLQLGGPRAPGEVARPIRNVVWVTADVHYAAAHHFDPARATTGLPDRAKNLGFDPFWEFVAGPIHAGSFGPNPLDPTLGPEVRFAWTPEPGREDVGPWDGLQNFGTLDVTPDALTARLVGIDGRERFRVEIPYVG